MLWNNDKLVDRHYLTLWEVIEYYGSKEEEPYLHVDRITDGSDHDMGLGQIINICVYDYTFDEITIDDDITRKMFTSYLWPEFQNAYVAIIDKERTFWSASEDVTKADVKAWAKQHMMLWDRWLVESKERYEPLISNLETIKNKLMDRIGSQSVTLFNDTPQNGGDFTTDPYTTNATKSTTESDVATPIARLKEVQDLLRNYYADWANEFSRFVYNGSYPKN